MTRQAGEPLGIRINGGLDGKHINPEDPEDDGIFVTEVGFSFSKNQFDRDYSQVKETSPAAGLLTVGTRILEVSNCYSPSLV